jgi:hypothetical protein
MTTSLQASQTCTIGGRPYLITGSSIEVALNQTPRIRFAIERDANSASLVPSFGEEVIITQVADVTQVFRGTVISVRPERGTNFTRYAIDAEGLAGLANHKRILNAYTSQDAQSFVRTAWNFYGPGVAYQDDVVSDPVEIQEYSSAYDSLMDLVNFASNTTGWAWFCQANTFRFFNPLNFPVSGTLTNMDFGAGTLRVSLDGASVFNVGRQQAYEYVTANFTEPMIPEEIRKRAFDTIQVIYCATRFKGPTSLAGLPFDQWEFVSGRVIRGVPAQGPNNPPLSEIEVGWSLEDQVVTTDIQLRAPPNTTIALVMPIQIEATFRRLVWLEVRDAGSIAAVGVREAPVLPNDGGVDVPEGLRRLTSYISQRSRPVVELSGTIMTTNINPGERRSVDIDELGVDQDFIVESVRRTFSRDGLQVDVVMRGVMESGARPARMRPDIGPEIFKRLEKIEGAGLNPASPAGAVWIGTTPIQGETRFEGSFEWYGEFEIEPLLVGITIEEDF